MASKQLGSILDSIPAATARGQNKIVKEIQEANLTPQTRKIDKTTQKQERIVASIPKELKEEIKHYMISNGLTEKVILLKALQKFGFNIKDEWLVDQRTQR